MSQFTDPIYLKTQQYQDAKNLKARIQLHEQFSINKYDWALWVFDQLKLPADSRILEVGGGTGRLWEQNLARIPPGWHITLSDFSPGMLAQSQANLQPAGAQKFAFAVLDVQQIPGADESYDAVIANHMLYHVPNRGQALQEIGRVLKPGGKLYAATNGRNHLRELHDLLAQVLPSASRDRSIFDRPDFRLENGREQLSPYFSEVTCHLYEDGLVVTEGEPLLAYSLSMGSSELIAENIAKLMELIKREIETRGAVRITKSTGLFEAQKET